MAKIARGITYSVNEYITAAKLHALVDSAISAADGFSGTADLYDIIFGNFTSTLRPIHTAASPASPAANDLAVGSDGLIDRYTGAAWVNLDEEFLYQINSSAITLTTGTPVVADASAIGSVTIWPGPGVCSDPLGVSMTVVAPTATAKIQMHGVAYVKVNNSVGTPRGSLLRVAAAGATMLTLTTAVTSEVLAVLMNYDPSAPLSGDALAILVR